MASDGHLKLPAYLFNRRADFRKKKPPKLKKPPTPVAVRYMVFSVRQINPKRPYRSCRKLSRNFYETPSRRQRATFTRSQSLAKLSGLSFKYAS